MSESDDTPCTGPCRKKPSLLEMSAGAAALGLALTALAGCPPVQALYGVVADDDDVVNDDDSAGDDDTADDDDTTVDQPLYGVVADDDDSSDE